MGMVYQWRNGFPSNGVSVDKVHQELAAIERAAGKVTPELTVAWAQNKTSAMHPIIFDKSDADAAYEYRLVVARTMIASVVMIPTESSATSEPKRVFIHVPDDADTNTDAHYGSIYSVSKDAVRRRLALKELWNELQSWRRRANEYKEFTRIVQSIEQDEAIIKQQIA